MREGWRETTLGEVVEVNPESMSTSSAPATFRYVDLSSVTPTRGIDEVELASYSLETAPGRARRIIRRGDVLVSTVRPYLRGFGYVSSSLDGEVASTGFCVLRAIPAIIESGFIWALVRTPDFVGHLMTRATGSNYPAVRPPDVASFPLLLPPLDEQRRIIDLIAAVDEAIEAAERVKASTDQARRGLLGELLSGERAEREGWHETTLGVLEASKRIELLRGKVISRSDIEASPGPYPVYSSAATNNGAFGHYGHYMFDEELITWSIDGGGHFFYRPVHKFSVTNVGGILRVLDSTLHCQFLVYELQYLHSLQRFDYQSKAHPSVIRHIYRLHLPPLDEQRRIADLIGMANAQVSSAESLTSTLRSLRSALLADLLSGDHEIPGSYDALLSA